MRTQAALFSLFATDQSNSVLHTGRHSMTYGPFGYCQNLMAAASGFNGEVFDPVMGGYLLGNGYRNYSPELQRFHTPDSLSPFEAGGINAYIYCEGDPINAADPSGHGRILKFFRNIFSRKSSLKKSSSLKNVSGDVAASSSLLKKSKSTSALNSAPKGVSKTISAPSTSKNVRFKNSTPVNTINNPASAGKVPNVENYQREMFFFDGETMQSRLITSGTEGKHKGALFITQNLAMEDFRKRINSVRQ